MEIFNKRGEDIDVTYVVGFEPVEVVTVQHEPKLSPGLDVLALLGKGPMKLSGHHRHNRNSKLSHFLCGDR